MHNYCLSCGWEEEESPTQNRIVPHITPCAKPRMTKRDRWKKRPCVERYFAFRDQIHACADKLEGVQIFGSHFIFVIPMPKSWSKKKKAENFAQAHIVRPDSDNLLKGFFDSWLAEDACVWDARASKFWGYTGAIIIREESMEWMEELTRFVRDNMGE